MMLIVHIAAGGLSLVLGAVALSAAKGGTLHRRSGMLFVYTMFTMTIGGLLLAVLRNAGISINVPAALLTVYLVATSLFTVRPLSARWRCIDRVLMALALIVGLTSLSLGIDALARGGRSDGIPAFPYFLFGIVGLLAGASDLRVIRSGGLHGVYRLTRHLWRMCFALFIAALSFFLGQSDEFPEALRIPALLMVPVVAVLVTMLYWLWRVRFRRSLRGLVGVRVTNAA
jgi:uncharacterized membrane protein